MNSVHDHVIGQLGCFYNKDIGHSNIDEGNDTLSCVENNNEECIARNTMESGSDPSILINSPQDRSGSDDCAENYLHWWQTTCGNGSNVVDYASIFHSQESADAFGNAIMDEFRTQHINTNDISLKFGGILSCSPFGH